MGQAPTCAPSLWAMEWQMPRKAFAKAMPGCGKRQAVLHQPGQQRLFCTLNACSRMRFLIRRMHRTERQTCQHGRRHRRGSSLSEHASSTHLPWWQRSAPARGPQSRWGRCWSQQEHAGGEHEYMSSCWGEVATREQRTPLALGCRLAQACKLQAGCRLAQDACCCYPSAPRCVVCDRGAASGSE